MNNILRVLFCTCLLRRSLCKWKSIIGGWGVGPMNDFKWKMFLIAHGIARVNFLSPCWICQDIFCPRPLIQQWFWRKHYIHLFPFLASFSLMPYHTCCSYTAKTLTPKDASLPLLIPKLAFPPQYSLREANHRHDNIMVGLWTGHGAAFVKVNMGFLLDRIKKTRTVGNAPLWAA